MSRKLKLNACVAVFLSFFGLLFTSCGSSSNPVNIDLDILYQNLSKNADTSNLIAVPPEKAYLIMGVNPDDCVQEKIFICSDSLAANELWLIQAKDETKAGEIEQLAKQRLGQKSMETENYLPEQYKVVQGAKLERNGTYVFLIVSQNTDPYTALIHDVLN